MTAMYQTHYPLWKDKGNYSYANYNRLTKEEPQTAALLKQEKDFRAEDIKYYYYVNFHEKYGYSVARKAKTTTTQSTNNDVNNSQQQPQTTPHPHQQQLTMEH